MRSRRNLLLLILLSIPMVTLFQNCANNYKIDTVPPEQLVISSVPICSFNGLTIPDGQSIPAYHDSSVPFGQSCISESRVCSNGQLSGTFAYASCSVGAPKACLFNGLTIPSGSSTNAFASSSVPFGQTCVSQSRNCLDGSLDGSYQFGSCAPLAPAACLFNGQTIPSGGAVTGYQSSSVPFGQLCVSQARNCLDGKLDGSYTFGSCAPAAPASCLFNGQTVVSGTAVTGYQSSTVPFGQLCVSQSRNCLDGQLDGSFQYGSCTPAAPASCVFNGQTVVSGTAVTGYQSSTVPFGQVCLSQNRNCVNGTLDGSYTFGSCTPAAPASCVFNGQTVVSGTAVTGYQSSTVPFGQLCVSQSRNCLDGSLDGSYQFGSCTPAAPASCLFNGQTIPDGNSVTAYENSSVSSGSQCVPQTRTCANGTLSGTFTNPSCTVAVCDPFTNPGPNCTSSSPGLKGSLFYEPPATVASEGGWSTLSTYFSRGTNTNITLVLSQLNVQTENFSVGFATGSGTYLSDLNGNKLVEWFAIQVDGILKMAPGDTPGNFEFATLTDDGSILFLRDPVTGQLVQRISNDGAHSTRLACIDKPVAMDATTQIPMRLQYFQGPRTEIALRMLYRPASTKAETLCGSSSGFFINTGAGNPYPEGASMTQLYNDGWKVVPASMFGSP